MSFRRRDHQIDRQSLFFLPTFLVPWAKVKDSKKVGDT